MITIDKFRDAVTAHFAWSRSVAWAVFAVGLLIFIGAWFAVRFFAPPGDMQVHLSLALIVGFVLLMPIVASVGACCNEGRFRYDTRLACPHCDRQLQIYSHLVIATRNCPHCGRCVVAEPLPPA